MGLITYWALLPSGTLAFFAKKLRKIAQWLGKAPRPPVNNTFDLQYTSLLNTRLPI